MSRLVSDASVDQRSPSVGGQESAANDLTWACKAFDSFDIHELYEILHLRQIIFTIEQNSIYLDVDRLDQVAIHLIGRQGGELVAYARILPSGVKSESFWIGRVVVAKRVRKLGIGRALMIRAVEKIASMQPEATIELKAMDYIADGFYRPLGFVRSGAVYDADGLPHVDMIWKANQKMPDDKPPRGSDR